MCHLARCYCCLEPSFVQAKVNSCSAGNFPSKGMNAMVLGKWPRAEKSYQFQGKTKPLFLRSTITMKCFLTLRGKKPHSFMGKRGLCRNTLLVFNPSPCKYLFSSRTDFNWVWQSRAISGIINFLSVLKCSNRFERERNWLCSCNTACERLSRKETV